MQPDLLPEVRALIKNPDVESGLRLLLIQAAKGSSIAESLRADLRSMLLDPAAALAHRYAAFDALSALGGENWPSIVGELEDKAGNDAVRLALEIVKEVGLRPFTDEMVVKLVIALAWHENRTTGLFLRLEQVVPDARVEPLLNELVEQIAPLGNRHERAGNNELTDLGYKLIARRLAAGAVHPARLWNWVKPFDAEVGYVERRARRSTGGSRRTIASGAGCSGSSCSTRQEQMPYGSALRG
jgi:hypothetical protein